MNLCVYGCGQEGKHQFKNGKWCCSKNSSQCPSIKLKNSRKNKGKKYPPLSLETRERMSIVAIKRYEDIKYREKMKRSMENKKIKTVQIEISYMFCSYGCGQFAKYFFPKVKKWCCSDHHLKCPSVHKKTIINQTPIAIKSSNKFCDYGCGQKAHYQLPKSGKYCCSKNWASCPAVRRKNSKTNIIKQTGKNNARYGVIVDDETRRKIRLGNIRDRKNKYGQIFPNYNKKACKIIEECGKQYDYNFQHAENGGEFYIKELGYWVDGYDKEKNVVIEVDEGFHFNHDGNLIKKDMKRQKEIKDFLNCKFIRIKNL